LLRKESRHIDLAQIIKESWWVLLFITLTFSGFIYAASSQKKVAVEITEKIKQLQIEQHFANEEREYLEQKLHSCDDPDYVKMILIKVLGLTPKGQQKVIFDT